MALDPKIFSAPPRYIAPSLALCTSGRERCGKSTFLMSAPGPIGLIVNDPNTLNRAIAAQATGKKIHIANFATGQWVAPLVGGPADFHKKRWDAIEKALRALVAEPAIRTIGIDTGTQLYADMRMATFGKLTQIMPVQYAKVNDELRQLIQFIRGSGKHLVVTHKLAPKYVNDKWDGKTYARDGWKDMSFQCTLDIQHEVTDVAEEDADRLNEGRRTRPQFTLRVNDCSDDASLRGLELYDGDATFLELAMRVYPEHDPELFVD